MEFFGLRFELHLVYLQIFDQLGTLGEGLLMMVILAFKTMEWYWVKP